MGNRRGRCGHVCVVAYLPRRVVDAARKRDDAGECGGEGKCEDDEGDDEKQHAHRAGGHFAEASLQKGMLGVFDEGEGGRVHGSYAGSGTGSCACGGATRGHFV